MSDTPEQLSRRAKDGDVDAASELVNQFYQRIYAYLRRLSGDDEEAADLTQKTFFKAWTSLASYEGRSSFSTWIHGIAHHVFLDWVRQRKPSEFAADEWWSNCASDLPNPFENAAERDLAERLYSMVDRLDADSKHAIHLHYFQGLSLSETAEVLNMALSTLKYRLHGTVQLLRGQLAESSCAKSRS